MKKSLYLFSILLLPLLASSQSIFDKYAKMEHVAAITINKNLLNMVSSLNIDTDDEAEDFMELAKGLNGIQVFITEDKKVSADMGATVKKYIKTSSLEELMRVKEEGMNVKFYAKEGKDENHVNELLMFISGLEQTDLDFNGRKLETVLVNLTGNIDLRKIGALTSKMNLPKELNKVQGGK